MYNIVQCCSQLVSCCQQPQLAVLVPCCFAANLKVYEPAIARGVYDAAQHNAVRLL